MSNPKEAEEYNLPPLLYILVMILLCTGIFLFFIKGPMHLPNHYKQMFRLHQTKSSSNQISSSATDLMIALQQAQNKKLEKQTAEDAARQQQESEQQYNQQTAALSPPEEGKHYADIIIERLKMKVPLYYGDTNALLRKGAGQYIGSSLPGKGSQILVAAHNTNYFKPLQNIIEGDIIKVITSYGEFHYKVVNILIAKATDNSTYNLSLDHEQLVLYTCYPFSGPPGKTERFFVYADLI